MEMLSMPVISTHHLDAVTNQRLIALGDSNPWCTCAKYEYGYFLYLEELKQPDTPQCLLDIGEWLKKADLPEKSGFVRLDQDADPAPGLKTYDW